MRILGYDMGGIYNINTVKHIDFDYLRQYKAYVFVNKTDKYLNGPFGINHYPYLLINYDSHEYKHIQLSINMYTNQMYYRVFVVDRYTNWNNVTEKFVCLFPIISEIYGLILASRCILNDKKYSLHLLIKKLISLINIDDLSCIIDEDIKKYEKLKSQAVACFIDDDSGDKILEIWGGVLKDKSFRLGFACITGYISGEIINHKEEYKQIEEQALINIYLDGNDVYAHSFSHNFFYLPQNTKRMIKNECKKSQEFILSRGFWRSSDILVYPGGLGRGRKGKKKVISRYFRYGVDTVGEGINYLDFFNYSIGRLNFDTTSFEDIKNVCQTVKAEQGILVFMSHAYELYKDKDVQICKINQVVDYLKEREFIILPLSEAIKYKCYFKTEESFERRISWKCFLKECYSDLKIILHIR